VDLRKSDLLAELTDVLSDGVAQDLWMLSIGNDNGPWGQYQPLINNWKTEETLERATVTLETQRIKGSNP
jgi:hypothetical protein